MIPFDWFRSRKKVLLNKEAALDLEIETLKTEQRVLNKRDERDKLLTEVKARRLVRIGNGSASSNTGGEREGILEQRQTRGKESSTDQKRERRVKVQSVSAQSRGKAGREGPN